MNDTTLGEADTRGNGRSALSDARAAYERSEWRTAYDDFHRASTTMALSADDTAALADAAWWLGEIDESLAISEESYGLYLRSDDPRPRSAAMMAIEIGFSWFLRGEEVIGSGWLSRAHRLLAHEGACVEQLYLGLLAIDEATAAGDLDGARTAARAIRASAAEFGDVTLDSYALVCEGIADIKSGRIVEGFAAVDEAMLPVVAGKVRPTFAGNIFCQLMSICHELADLRRAEQWTDATARWCEGFSDAVMFIGVCRVHRAQLLQVRGEWELAEREIDAVRTDLAAMNVVAVGLALYELGEIRRMRGDLRGASDAYVEGHRFGRDPHPGLALVWVAEGDAPRALEALTAANATIADPLAQARLAEAIVVAGLAAGRFDTANRAADALDDVADRYRTSGLTALSRVSRGRVQLAAGHLEPSVESLRAALRAWRNVDAPWRVAQTRLELARALRALGDNEGAELERRSAEASLAELGAPTPHDTLPDGITPREAEVLTLVAEGLTNRQIAQRLVLSERTVARHLANLYLKIDVGTRSAATTYAHRHGLAGVHD